MSGKLNEMDVGYVAKTKRNRIVSVDVLKKELSTMTSLHKQQKELEEILSTKTEEGWAALHVAVITSNEEMVSQLLSIGADSADVDVDGRTPFHWSAFRNVSFKVFASIARVLKNRSLEQKDRFGKTPLHYVCLNKSTGLFENNEDKDIRETLQKLRFLLAHSENLEHRDVEGSTPLLLLCKNIHNYATAEELSSKEIAGILENSEFKCRSACGVTLEMFLKSGANIMTQNDYGVSPLHAACKANCTEMTRILISQLQHLSESQVETEKKPMEIIGHSTDACGNTPMLSVFKSNTCRSLEYNALAPSPWSYLNDLKERFQDSLRPILKHMRSTVNVAKSTSGCTVLHYALADCLSSADVVKGLIGYGKANVNVRNVQGKTPLHFAVLPDLSFNPEEIRELLVQHRKCKVDLLLGNGAELNAKDLCGSTPLHDAVLAGDEELVDLLLQNNADINAVNKYGDTPLDLTNFCQKESEIVFSIKCRLHKKMGERLRDQSKDSENSSSKKGEPLQQSVEEAQVKLSQYQIQEDSFLYPVHIKDAESWFQENPSKWTLTDQKIQVLLRPSKSKSLSNDTSENIVLCQTVKLMKTVFKEVEKLDPRFKVSLELSGSTREGSKVDKPDEFDMLCFLDGFQTICEVEESEPGFVRCKLIEREDNATFGEFFDDSKFLNGSKLTSALYSNIKISLGKSHVWKSAPALTLGEKNHEYEYEDALSGILCLHLLYTDENYRYMPLSVDVVPAIRNPGWWPTFARQEGELVTSYIKKQGCMVITKPRMMKTLSDERVKFMTQLKVSVYLSECSVLKSLPETIRDAYKLAKILLRQTELFPSLHDTPEDVYEGDDYNPDIPEMTYHPTDSYLQSSFSSYMLKNALLYELEEESRQRQSSPQKRDIQELFCCSLDEKETEKPALFNVTRRWTVRLFRRLLKLSRSDEFLPYFMPTNSLIVKRGPDTLTDIQETFYKVIIAILDGIYEN